MRDRIGHSPAVERMISAVGIILVLTVALLAGVVLRSRWALLLPAGMGASIALVITITGHALGDTPLPFLVVAGTVAMCGGQGVRQPRAA